MTRNSNRRKLNKKGFTLLEMLVTLVILVLFGTIVTMGVNAALKTYRTMTIEAHFRVLQDDINTAFGGLVRSSTIVESSVEPDSTSADNPITVDGGKLYFRCEQYSATLGYGEMVLDDNGHICLQAKDAEIQDYSDCYLVSPKVYDNMKVTGLELICGISDNSPLITLRYTISTLDGSKTGTYECSYRTVNTNTVENLSKSTTETSTESTTGGTTTTAKNYSFVVQAVTETTSEDE